MSFNPYQPPTSAYDGNYTQPVVSGVVVSDRIIQALRKTRPWVLLIAIVAFVGAGFVGLFGLIAAVKAPAEGFGAVFAAVIYLLPGVAMLRFSNAINKLLHGGGYAELEQSIETQAALWQVLGIYTLIGLVFMVLGVLVAFVVGAALFS